MVLKRKDDTSLGVKWNCYIICKKEDEPNVWVDLNNNGKKDEKEAVTSFTYYESGDYYNVDSPVSSGVIVVYGKVTKFGCAANELTALEVSKNTNLVELNCGENHLTALDVTKNTNLVVLGFNYNKITELDVTKNTKLQRFRCYENKLDKTNMEKIIAALPNYTTGGKPKFYGWGENENNYKSVELRNQLVAKGWVPYHTVGGYSVEWK